MGIHIFITTVKNLQSGASFMLVTK